MKLNKGNILIESLISLIVLALIISVIGSLIELEYNYQKIENQYEEWI